MVHAFTEWIKRPCERSYPSCLIAVIILLFLLSCSSLPVFARTNRQAGSSAGVLDYCEESARAPCLSPSPPERGIPISASDSLSLSLSQTWSGSAYQFSLARQRHKPHVRTPAYPVSLRHRAQSQALAGLVVCLRRIVLHKLLHVKYLKRRGCVQTLSLTFCEAGNNWSAFKLAAVCTGGCTLTEPGPRTHLTLLIPHLAACPGF